MVSILMCVAVGCSCRSRRITERCHTTNRRHSCRITDRCHTTNRRHSCHMTDRCHATNRRHSCHITDRCHATDRRHTADRCRSHLITDRRHSRHTADRHRCRQTQSLSLCITCVTSPFPTAAESTPLPSRCVSLKTSSSGKEASGTLSHGAQVSISPNLCKEYLNESGKEASGTLWRAAQVSISLNLCKEYLNQSIFLLEITEHDELACLSVIVY